MRSRVGDDTQRKRGQKAHTRFCFSFLLFFNVFGRALAKGVAKLVAMAIRISTAVTTTGVVILVVVVLIATMAVVVAVMSVMLRRQVFDLGLGQNLNLLFAPAQSMHLDDRLRVHNDAFLVIHPFFWAATAR